MGVVDWLLVVNDVS